MKSIKIGVNYLSYDDAGQGPALLLLSGWCQDHRLFKRLAPELTKTNRVIRLDWRGHGEIRTHDGDFATADQARDIIAFMDSMNVSQAVPVSTSHGGWANIEAADWLGAARVPKIVVIDWIQTRPSEAFFAALNRIQDAGKWKEGRRDLFDYWIGDTGNADIINHINAEMAAFGFDMWARSCREIAQAYAKWDYPMKRMAALKELRPVAHIYSQPFEPEYTRTQQDFAERNPWFEPHKLTGQTHFPALEQPVEVAAAIRKFLAAPEAARP